MRRRYLYSVFLFIGCSLISANGMAAGRIVLQPVIETKYQYDSNYLKTDTKEVSVNTYVVRPGIVFGYETAKTNIALAATVDGYWYEAQDTPPPGVRNVSDDDYVGFTGVLTADHQLTDRLNLGISDEMYITRDPAQADANSNSVNRDKYTINYLEPKIYYEFSDKFGILTKYRNTITDYEKNLDDSNEHRGIFDFYYTMNSRSAIYLDYQTWQRTYDQNSSDYVSNQLSLNYERQLRYFTIKGGAGYHHRDFDNASLSDLDLFSWKVQIKGQDPDSTLKTTRSRISLGIGQEANDDGAGDDYFNATFVRLEGGYRLFRSIEASAKAQFQNSDYKTAIRDEDTYLASARLAYQALDYLNIGVEGGYETRNSNVDSNDYDNTFVLLTLDIAYDLGSR